MLYSSQIEGQAYGGAVDSGLGHVVRWNEGKLVKAASEPAAARIKEAGARPCSGFGVDIDAFRSGRRSYGAALFNVSCRPAENQTRACNEAHVGGEVGAAHRLAPGSFTALPQNVPASLTLRTTAARGA